MAEEVRPDISVVGDQLRGLLAHGGSMLDLRVCASVEEFGGFSDGPVV
jgi:hypothetical protein